MPESCQQGAQTDCARALKETSQLQGQELPEAGGKYLMGPPALPDSDDSGDISEHGAGEESSFND